MWTTASGGAKESRPALALLLKDAKRRRFDVLIVWRLNRLGAQPAAPGTAPGRTQELRVALLTLGEGIDTS